MNDSAPVIYSLQIRLVSHAHILAEKYGIKFSDFYPNKLDFSASSSRNS